MYIFLIIWSLPKGNILYSQYYNFNLNIYTVDMDFSDIKVIPDVLLSHACVYYIILTGIWHLEMKQYILDIQG